MIADKVKPKQAVRQSVFPDEFGKLMKIPFCPRRAEHSDNPP
jgi:hypothetical protein